MHVSIIIFWLHLFSRVPLLSVSFSFSSSSSSLSFVLIHLGEEGEKEEEEEEKEKKENLPDNIIERSDARASNAHVRDRTPSSILHERRCACCLLLLDEHLDIELGFFFFFFFSVNSKPVYSSKTIQLPKSFFLSLSLDYQLNKWRKHRNVRFMEENFSHNSEFSSNHQLPPFRRLPAVVI